MVCVECIGVCDWEPTHLFRAFPSYFPIHLSVVISNAKQTLRSAVKFVTVPAVYTEDIFAERAKDIRTVGLSDS